MSKSPAFQFYAHDFLAGRVATYTLDEVGAYSVLLAHDWTLTGLPLEPEKLARLCRVSMRKFRPLWATIGEQFPERDGRRFNPRLALEREKQAANRKKKQDAAHSRWNAEAHADALQAQCSPSPSPSPVKKQKNPAPVGAKLKASVPPYDSIFEEAWAAYPRRAGNSKAEAWIQWLKRVAEGVDALDMLTAARAYATHCAAQGWADGRFVMMARTFYGPSKRFADDWTVVTEPAGPIVDEFGVLTPYGERVTRPVRVA